jgi:hypothetical protein
MKRLTVGRQMAGRENVRKVLQLGRVIEVGNRTFKQADPSIRCSHATRFFSPKNDFNNT